MHSIPTVWKGYYKRYKQIPIRIILLAQRLFQCYGTKIIGDSFFSVYFIHSPRRRISLAKLMS